MPTQTPVRESLTSTMHQSQSSAPKSVFDAIPLGLVLRLASPYLAGETAEAAISLARKNYAEKHYCGTLDILGEDMTSEDDCEASVLHYQSLIDAIKANPLPVTKRREQLTISFKPSMFSTMAPQPGTASDKALEAAFDRITRVVDYALKKEVNVTLEAEDKRWTNFHLESYFALINAGYLNCGTVLQTRLFRTEKDLSRFDERMRVRLVIGIYNEPAQIAHTDKRVMKDLLLQFGQVLLSKGTYVELATHDVNCIEQFYEKVAVPGRFTADRFEHQFLQGVPRGKVQQGLIDGSYFEQLKASHPASNHDHLDALSKAGVPVRMYYPFGTAKVSGAYCRRRLKENPNMIAYGIKNLFGLQ